MSGNYSVWHKYDQNKLSNSWTCGMWATYIANELYISGLRVAGQKLMISEIEISDECKISGKWMCH
jgi:hypothetical protein